MLLNSRLQILHFGRSVAAGVITEAALLQDSPRGLPRPRPPPLELSGDFGTLTSVLSLSQISLLPISSSTSVGPYDVMKSPPRTVSDQFVAMATFLK